MTNLTDKNFYAEILRPNQPSLVYFYVPWYEPCKQLEPLFKKILSLYDKPGLIKVGKYDVSVSNNYIALQYHVMSVPTFLFFIHSHLMSILFGEDIDDWELWRNIKLQQLCS